MNALYAGPKNEFLSRLLQPKRLYATRHRLQSVMKMVKPTTLDMGRFKNIRMVPEHERRVHANLLQKVTDFDQLKINSQVRDAIYTNLLDGKKKPTAVQKLAIKALRRNRPEEFKTWLLAAETGSGKTLAYTAPLFSDLLEHPRPEAPYIRGIILVPTIELVDQISTMIQKMDLPLKDLAVRGNKNANLAKQISHGADVVISTPDKLLSFFDRYKILSERALAHCQSIVVDEADSLMNESFIKSTTAVFAKVPQLSDLIFVTATIPRYFDKELKNNYPDTIRLVTPSIHRLPRHIDFRVIEVWRPPYRSRKELAVQQALYAIYNDNTEPGLTKRAVVFVNKRTQVQPLTQMLRKAGYDANGIDGTCDIEERERLIRDFVEKPKDEGVLKVLIATDLVARGIDMNRVRNIILYDLPMSAADLLHRAGRTGRLNQKGRVILFVSKSESKGWVRGLQTIVRKGEALA